MEVPIRLGDDHAGIVCRTCKVVHAGGHTPDELRAANRLLVARGTGLGGYPAADPSADAWKQPRVSLTALLRKEVI